ncbi:MAG: hypothetical protein KJ583_07775 [Nanoarchaeota archaeon]|nr:hypothetical protein [Nanoarchaeota archaeon]MBU1270453.1 hypothetical protein [Nanoarchaeota archaeon]MBU1605185.1 hypothetical protein [Nanoarchaeota archaeon]MBU2443703.1 hypothetical protein [Nanoarchaeota archaeon]
MNHRKERQRIREMERIFHFCGNSFFDEVSPTERASLADKYLSWISKNQDLLSAFEAYKPSSVTLTWTFESRISGLSAVIANYIAGNSLFDRRIVANAPKFQESQFFRHDPYFGTYVDTLVGEPGPPEMIPQTDLRTKDIIKIADFACAPKKDGCSSILFLEAVLPILFPNKKFEFFGYDIDFQERYPQFDGDGNFKGWQEGYSFDSRGVAHHNGLTYYNAAQNPQFNLVPQKKGGRFTNTFDVSHNKYDIIINSMFYSVLEMNGEPEESLRIMRENLLSLKSSQGVVFLNACDDCFKIFPAKSDDALPVVVPFISSMSNIEQKIGEILTGGKYCKGVYDVAYNPPTEERKRVEAVLYLAHRLSRKDLTFLDRLFETYERINEGANLEDSLSCLTNPDLMVGQERRKYVRDRVYAIKQGIESR